MKTSNKILLGIFLATVLILTSIHVALYAKYKRGDFIPVKQIAAERDKNILLPPITFVSVTGMVNVELFSNHSFNQTGQSQLEIENRPQSLFAYRVSGDSLFLVGDSTADKNSWEQGQRNRQMLRIDAPDLRRVKVAYGSLQLFGGLDSAHAPSYSVELATHAHLGVVPREPVNTPVFFNRLDLVTNASNVELDKGTMVKELNVRSKESNLIFKQATIGHIKLDVDSTTTVTLLGKSLKDVQVISKP